MGGNGMGWDGMGREGRGPAGRGGGGVLLRSLAQPGPAAPAPLAGDGEGGTGIFRVYTLTPNSTLRYSYMPS